MDTLTTTTFSSPIPIRHPAVIIHLVFITLSFLGCYPIALIQGTRCHPNRHFVAIGLGTIFALIGSIAGLWMPSTSSGSLVPILVAIVGGLLMVLVLMQIVVGLNMTRRSLELHRLPPYSHTSWLPTQTPTRWCATNLPEYTHLIIGWSVLIVASIYLILTVVLFTESCAGFPYRQCFLPLVMGGGLLGYGTMALLHLVGVLSLPRTSTPEYYEGLLITLWGLFNLFMADTPLLGSNWLAGNLGLLWFTGGLFSITISIQTWMPAMRERNIMNSVIVCLTGRAIMGSLTMEAYSTQVQVALGYVCIVGSVGRALQVTFRKSPSDNLPRLLPCASGELEDEDLDSQPDAYSATQPCRHKSVFASITIVCGMLSCFMAMAAGILLMGATPGWIQHVSSIVSDPSTYVNLLFAATFLWATYILAMLTVYKTTRMMPQYECIGLDDVSHGHVQSKWTAALSSVAVAVSLSATGGVGGGGAGIGTGTGTGTGGSSNNGNQSPDEMTRAEIEQSKLYEERRDVRRSRSLPLRASRSWSVRPEEAEPPLRPSQYRAKRRSLLIQSPPPQPQLPSQPQLQSQVQSHADNPTTRSRSSSAFGVGGVLSDNLFELTKDLHIRPSSWHNNNTINITPGSSVVSVGSNSGSSISFDTPTHSTPDSKRTVIFSLEDSPDTAETVDYKSIRKTESGKRKDRQKGKRRRTPDTQGHDGDASNSCCSSSEERSVAKYYSSERNSSDSHVP
ncbi:hypothetical protein F4703DRAFT_1916157 [Phycomyces blakesleeanus]